MPLQAVSTGDKWTQVNRNTPHSSTLLGIQFHTNLLFFSYPLWLFPLKWIGDKMRISTNVIDLFLHVFSPPIIYYSFQFQIVTRRIHTLLSIPCYCLKLCSYPILYICAGLQNFVSFKHIWHYRLFEQFVFEANLIENFNNTLSTLRSQDPSLLEKSHNLCNYSIIL